MYPVPMLGCQRPYGRSISEPASASVSSHVGPDSGDQPPVHTKTGPAPADYGFGRDDDEGLLPSRPDPVPRLRRSPPGE